MTNKCLFFLGEGRGAQRSIILVLVWRSRERVISVGYFNEEITNSHYNSVILLVAKLMYDQIG